MELYFREGDGALISFPAINTISSASWKFNEPDMPCGYVFFFMYAIRRMDYTKRERGEGDNKGEMGVERG